MTVELRTRRRLGLLIRFGLVIVAVGVVVGWVASRTPRPPDHIGVQREAPAVAILAPGDLQIVSTDGNIALTLQGDKLMGGLSPATIAKVKDEMAKSTAKDSTGFGGMVAGIVKSSVASAIGTQITYPIAEIMELRFDRGRLIIKTRDGGDREHNFGDIKVDDSKEPARFSDADAERFVAAFLARKRELGLP